MTLGRVFTHPSKKGCWQLAEAKRQHPFRHTPECAAPVVPGLWYWENRHSSSCTSPIISTKSIRQVWKKGAVLFPIRQRHVFPLTRVRSRRIIYFYAFVEISP